MEKYIKLTEDLPVAIEHGMKAGLVLKVERLGRGNNPRWYVMSPETHVEVGVMSREAVEVDHPQNA